MNVNRAHYTVIDETMRYYSLTEHVFNNGRKVYECNCDLMLKLNLPNLESVHL